LGVTTKTGNPLLFYSAEISPADKSWTAYVYERGEREREREREREL